MSQANKRGYVALVVSSMYFVRVGPLNRTQVQRTNLAIYSINCGILHLVFTISCITLLAKYRIPNVHLCHDSTLSLRAHVHPELTRQPSRDARRTGGWCCHVHPAQCTHGYHRPYGAQGATEASTNTAVPKSLPPASASSDKSLYVIAFNRERYLGPQPF
ncbi:hypothetical protein EDB85DRAFT_143383 [Lactarius pseudohatsudake]|nr:hypothetical protein EDB85DRAFT_143383 [Lactarius pseudohatsudake]